MHHRPFRAPHHTISEVAMVGGGSIPRPGEISLAHNGVLFLDELPEFDRRVLEALRQPLEEGRVTIARSARTSSFPARFMLVAAMNPCPCGFLGDRRRACRCSDPQIQRYASRISGPLRDRIDLVVEVPAIGSSVRNDRSANDCETSAVIRSASRRGATAPAGEIRQRQSETQPAARRWRTDGMLQAGRALDARARSGDSEILLERARMRPRAASQPHNRRFGRLPLHRHRACRRGASISVHRVFAKSSPFLNFS